MNTNGVFSGPSQFNITEFLKKPTTTLRIISVIFAIIVFGCVSAGAYTNKGVCIFNGVQSTCSYAIAIGVIAFLGAIGFLISDVMFNTISNLNTRRYIVLGNLAFSGLWTLLWFVSFCVLTNAWGKTSEDWIEAHLVESWQGYRARTAMVFSFFSTFLWGGIAFFALRLFRQGQGSLGPHGTVIGENSAETSAGGGMHAPSTYSAMPENPPAGIY